MPIYEYQCTNERCGHRFELLCKIGEPNPDVCPKCSEPAPTRALNAPRFLLKGKGWYMSDFRESDRPLNGVSLARGEEEGAAKPAEASSDGKADEAAKPADKGKAVNGAQTAAKGDEGGGDSGSAKPPPAQAPGITGSSPAREGSRPSD